MPDKITVDFGGKPHPASHVHVNQSQEHWNVYLLEDGSTIRVKSVLVSVARIDDAYDTEGNPVYWTNSRQVATVDAPQNLRKRQ